MQAELDWGAMRGVFRPSSPIQDLRSRVQGGQDRDPPHTPHPLPFPPETPSGAWRSNLAARVAVDEKAKSHLNLFYWMPDSSLPRLSSGSAFSLLLCCLAAAFQIAPGERRESRDRAACCLPDAQRSYSSPLPCTPQPLGLRSCSWAHARGNSGGVARTESPQTVLPLKSKHRHGLEC